MNKGKVVYRRYKHDIYKKISHATRLRVIYAREIHKQPVKDIEGTTGLCANTIWNILNAYTKTGRTNKKAYTKKTSAVRIAPPQKKLTGASLQRPSLGLQSSLSLTVDSHATSVPVLGQGREKSRGQERRNEIFRSLVAAGDGVSKSGSRQINNQSATCGLRLFVHAQIGEGAEEVPASVCNKQPAENGQTPPISLTANKRPDLQQDTLQLLSHASILYREPELLREDGEAEVIANDISVFENEKETKARLFGGSFSFLNDLVQEQEGKHYVGELGQLPAPK